MILLDLIKKITFFPYEFSKTLLLADARYFSKKIIYSFRGAQTSFSATVLRLETGSILSNSF
jgi:hypothetical protein